MPMKREDKDEWLDLALEDSFPASDPFSPHQVRPADGRSPDALEPDGDPSPTNA